MRISFLKKIKLLTIFITLLFVNLEIINAQTNDKIINTKENAAVANSTDKPSDTDNSSTPEFFEPKIAEDPYEEYNRRVFISNQKFDQYVAKPAATAYNFILPDFLIYAIGNFFDNLKNLPIIVNDSLQGEFYMASANLWRFIINSTYGLGGVLNLSQEFSLPPSRTQDFGLTLAKWGYTDSNYLVLPFIGPSTVRDTLAIPVNYILNQYYYIDSQKTQNLFTITYLVNKRANLAYYEKEYGKMILDPYTFLKNAYLQNRIHLIEKSPPQPRRLVRLGEEKTRIYYYLDQ